MSKQISCQEKCKENAFVHRMGRILILKQNYLKNSKATYTTSKDQYIQYVALGPRVKVIILNILPELKPDGLKFPLKIDLMSLAIIAK